jgi:hypothetical protein
MNGAFGNFSFCSGTSAPLGPSSKLVVRMVGSLEVGREVRKREHVVLEFVRLNVAHERQEESAW